MENIPLWYWLIVFFAFGACVGSFYNVIVYRMPRGISLINPPSYCPLCKKHIPIRYNLPIIGWLILKGKSACCHKPISVIYPIGEALCGILGSLALFSVIGVNYQSFDFKFLFAPVLDMTIWAKALGMFWLLLGAYPIFAIDCKYKLIPDSISIGGIIVGLLLSIIPGGITPFQSLLGMLVSGLGLYVLGLIATKILKKEAMGFGDVKLLAGYGALMGLTNAIETLILASILGIIIMIPRHKKGQIPFGPFLAVAAPIILLFGDTFLNLYLNFILQ